MRQRIHKHTAYIIFKTTYLGMRDSKCKNETMKNFLLYDYIRKCWQGAVLRIKNKNKKGSDAISRWIFNLWTSPRVIFLLYFSGLSFVLNNMKTEWNSISGFHVFLLLFPPTHPILSLMPGEMFSIEVGYFVRFSMKIFCKNIFPRRWLKFMQCHLLSFP